MRNDPLKTDADKAQFALKAWLEADAIEAALNRHTCDLERNFIFQGREYLFKSVKLLSFSAHKSDLTSVRMCVSYEFRRFIPFVPAYVHPLCVVHVLTQHSVV